MNKLLWTAKLYQRGPEWFAKARNRETGQYREKRLPGIATKREAEAERRAWEYHLNETGVSVSRVRLSDAVEAFLETHGGGLRCKSAARYRSALNWLMADVGDVLLDKISSGTVAGVIARYGKSPRLPKRKTAGESTEGKTERQHTQAGTAALARHLRTFFKWTEKRGMTEGIVVDVPRVDDAPERPGCAAESLDKILDKVPHLRPDDAEGWRRLVLVCRHAGLRVGEALRLMWGDDGAIGVSRSSRGTWQFKFTGAGQKSGRTEVIPCTPEMCRLFDAWSTEGTKGRVCRTLTTRDENASRIVSELFRLAGVAGSAHSLRRQFARQWAERLSASDLMKLCRHSQITTTLKYYLSRDAESLADRLALADSGKGAETLANSLAAGFRPAGQM